MTPLDATLAGLAGLLALVFLGRAVALARAPRLEDQGAPDPPAWPTLAVIIPARDEAATLEPAVASLLAQDYPSLQVVLVDDRSTDDTGRLMDALAARDPRVRVVHLEDLPEGWLGKVHALQRGLDVTDAGLLLFADVDTHYAPGALRRAVAVLEYVGAGHLTLLPHLEPRGLLQRALMANFYDTYVERLRGRASPVVKSGGPSFGFGAFNLVRRGPFERTPGLPWLKMDIADDLALGQMMREQGPSAFLLAPRTLSLVFYASAREALVGWEKNAFGILARFSVLRAALLSGAVLVLGLVPLASVVAALRPGASPALGMAAAAAILGLVVNAVIGWVRLRRTLVGALLEPLAWGVMAFALAWGTWRCIHRGGVLWRGRLYPTQALREGMRSRFP